MYFELLIKDTELMTVGEFRLSMDNVSVWNVKNDTDQKLLCCE